jgi:hypothetical protein
VGQGATQQFHACVSTCQWSQHAGQQFYATPGVQIAFERDFVSSAAKQVSPGGLVEEASGVGCVVEQGHHALGEWLGREAAGRYVHGNEEGFCAEMARQKSKPENRLPGIVTYN